METHILEVDLAAKSDRLRCILRDMGSIVVAFSGGTDSAYLLAASLSALGSDRVLAVTADAPIHARKDIAGAAELAQTLGCRHRVIALPVMDNDEFTRNSHERCYVCKLSLFQL